MLSLVLAAHCAVRLHQAVYLWVSQGVQAVVQLYHAIHRSAVSLTIKGVCMTTYLRFSIVLTTRIPE